MPIRRRKHKFPPYTSQDQVITRTEAYWQARRKALVMDQSHEEALIEDAIRKVVVRLRKKLGVPRSGGAARGGW